MSSTEEATELKAGHPPAVKAGGMRVARSRQTSTGESKEPATADGEGEQNTVTPKSEKHNQKLLISGAVTSGDSDFSPAAVKQFHDKPLPTKERHPINTPHNIHQPR